MREKGCFIEARFSLPSLCGTNRKAADSGWHVDCYGSRQTSRRARYGRVLTTVIHDSIAIRDSPVTCYVTGIVHRRCRRNTFQSDMYVRQAGTDPRLADAPFATGSIPSPGTMPASARLRPLNCGAHACSCRPPNHLAVELSPSLTESRQSNGIRSFRRYRPEAMRVQPYDGLNPDTSESSSPGQNWKLVLLVWWPLR